MYYEINVSLNGKHLFATHERSLRGEYDFRKVVELFKEKFPEEEGYQLTATFYREEGIRIDI